MTFSNVGVPMVAFTLLTQLTRIRITAPCLSDIALFIDSALISIVGIA
jgi:hypothetical protein